MNGIIIYGIGHSYHECFEDYNWKKSVIDDMNVKIVALCDGNQNIWGREISLGEEKYYIQNICEISEKNWDKIVVTSKIYYESIKDSLIHYGFNNQDIIQLDEFVYKILFEGNYKYKMSIVLMIRNESRYIREWIEYHRLVGVDHFYIYDNQSTDGLEQTLSNYISDGIVSYHFWKGEQAEAIMQFHTINGKVNIWDLMIQMNLLSHCMGITF